MKYFNKRCLCTLIMLTVCTVLTNITVPDIVYAQTEQIIDLDLSELNAGDAVPDAVALGSGTSKNTNKFSVIEVDESVSKTKKAVEYISSESDQNNNSEIYFNVTEMNTTEVSEPTDYYIDIKLMHYPASGAIESGMVVKYVFYNSENTTKSNDRLFFMGFGGSNVNGEYVVRANAGAGGGYAQGFAEPNEWYRLIYDIHIEPDRSKNCVNLKMYKVGDEEPADWQTTLTSDNFKTTGTSFNDTMNIDIVGIKAYKSLMKFADFSIYKYTAEDFELYDSVRKRIDEAEEKIKSGSMTFDEAAELDAPIQSEIKLLEGSLKNLAEEAWHAVYSDISKSIENIDKAQGIIAELEDAQISNDNYGELYSRLCEAREAAQNIFFADKSQSITSALDALEERFIGFAMKNFSANEYFDYPDGYNLSDTSEDADNGWAQGWSIQSGSASIKNGKLIVTDGFSASRNLKNPITYVSGRKYYLSWTMTAELASGIDFGGIYAGIAEDGGKLYPKIAEEIGTQELTRGKEYKFILVTDTENLQCGLYIYGGELAPKTEYYVVSDIENMQDITEIGIHNTGGGAQFDDIILQMYAASYGQSAFEKTFKAYNAPCSTDEEAKTKFALEKEAEELVKKLDEGILKKYLSYICSMTERNIFDIVTERLFNELDTKLTVVNADKAQKEIDNISNEELKKEYQGKLDIYYEKIRMSTPIIESVGLQGVLKSGNVVSAVVKAIDSVGNGAEHMIEWYVSGRKVSEAKSINIKSDWAGSSIYCVVTPVNNVGIKGNSVTSSKGKISSSGGGSGGSGGGGGSGFVSIGSSNNGNFGAVTNSPVNTDVLLNDAEYKTEKFLDVSRHWAKSEIYRAFEKGIVAGVSDNCFEPDRNITRAEFVRLLFKALEIPESNVRNIYADVNENAWYAPCVNAVSEAGLVEGSDGYFRPEETINRQETAKIIALAYKAETDTNIKFNNIAYEDKEKISQWAQEYVNLCTGLGLMTGIEDNIFSPLSGTTRAQAVVIIMRLVDILQ